MPLPKKRATLVPCVAKTSIEPTLSAFKDAISLLVPVILLANVKVPSPFPKYNLPPQIMSINPSLLKCSTDITEEEVATLVSTGADEKSPNPLLLRKICSILLVDVPFIAISKLPSLSKSATIVFLLNKVLMLPLAISVKPTPAFLRKINKFPAPVLSFIPTAISGLPSLLKSPIETPSAAPLIGVVIGKLFATKLEAEIDRGFVYLKVNNAGAALLIEEACVPVAKFTTVMGATDVEPAGTVTVN